MTQLYVSDQVTFVGGRRYRPGQEFALPEGVKPAPNMRKVGEAKARKPTGDTKPPEATAAAKAKQTAGNADSKGGDTKPPEAATAAATKTGGATS